MEKYIKGRLGNELSVCSIASELLLKKIVSYFGSGCRLIPGFELYIDMKIDRDANIFHLDVVRYRYLKKDNNPSLLKITDNKVDKYFESKFDKPAGVCMQAVFDLCANLIDKKIAVVPVVINYGLNTNMSHQCCFFIFNNTILFYEPYGKYSKYDCFYDSAILSIFNESSLVKKNNYKLDKFHNYFNLYGIQTMMIEYGIQNYDDFWQQFCDIKNTLNATNVENENDSYDKTYGLCDLMDIAENNKQALKKAAELYYAYSAKICVSNTLVEVFQLLDILKNNGDVTTEMNKWYDSIGSESPTAFILDRLCEILKTIYPDKIYTFILDTCGNLALDKNQICRYLTESSSVK